LRDPFQISPFASHVLALHPLPFTIGIAQSKLELTIIGRAFIGIAMRNFKIARPYGM
jgi:hypothetical protein